MGKCESCSEDDRKLGYGLIAFFSAAALLLWYFFAWRPLFRGFEEACFGKAVQPSDEDEQMERRSLIGKIRHAFEEHFSRDAFRIMVAFFQVHVA